MTGTFPLSSSPTKAPSDALLCDQTLVNVPIAHADTGARRRLAQKRAVLTPYSAPADTPLHRATDEHGVTRWYDAQGVAVARSSTSAEDAAIIGRINAELAPKPRPFAWTALIAAAFVLAVVALRSCSH